jgi:MULE transposase domain/SWIM zinc finger
MIAGAIKRELAEDMNSTIKGIRALLRAKFPGVTPSYSKVWRGREEAIAQIFGSWEGSYGILPRLFIAIQSTNPGMKYTILSEPTNRSEYHYFKCAAWTWGPCIEAFKYLRPVISIDAAFLSGRYEGRLLMACGYDAENQLIPLAFALVEKENRENWGWFMSWLRREVTGPGRIGVISDQHLAIKAIFQYPQYGWSEQNGDVVHRYCMQHISENLYKTCPDQHLVELFKWTAAKKKPRRFKEGMLSIRQQYPKGYQFLLTVGTTIDENDKEIKHPSKWAQCKDKGYRWGIMTSNGSESLNRVFKTVRCLPVVAIVEGTWYKCVSWFDERRNKSMTLINEGKLWSRKVTEKLNKRAEKSRSHRVDPYGSDLGDYEVIHHGETLSNGDYENFKYTVNIKEGSMPKCDCLKPNLTGIPCSHVLAVIRVRKFELNQFVCPFYSAQALLNTWSSRFYPYPNQIDWPEYNGPNIIPERRLIRKGRRKHIRIPMVMDEMQGRRGKCGSRLKNSGNYFNRSS